MAPSAPAPLVRLVYEIRSPLGVVRLEHQAAHADATQPLQLSGDEALVDVVHDWLVDLPCRQGRRLGAAPSAIELASAFAGNDDKPFDVVLVAGSEDFSQTQSALPVGALP